MTRNLLLTVSVVILIFLNPGLQTHGQMTDELNPQILDMKLELLDSKIDLFNSQLTVWETKPDELEYRLEEVDRKIRQLNFDPVYFNTKLHEIELLIDAYNQNLEKQLAKESKPKFNPFRPDSIPLAPYSTAISINPFRLFEGTLQLSYERAISPRIGITVSGMATYATEQGVSSYYIKNQELAYYNAVMDSYLPYNNKNISGYGLELKLKNYLLTDHYLKQRAPVGLYAAPHAMFRRLWLTGLSQYLEEDEWIEEEVTQLLNIFTFGASVGWKFTLMKVLYIDAYAGGAVRLARYDHEDKFTRYKSLGNIDFSGVMPVVGLSVGILK